MNAQEALALIDRALATVQADRASHAKLMEALKIVSEALSPKPKEEPPHAN